MCGRLGEENMIVEFGVKKCLFLLLGENTILWRLRFMWYVTVLFEIKFPINDIGPIYRNEHIICRYCKFEDSKHSQKSIYSRMCAQNWLLTASLFDFAFRISPFVESLNHIT